MTTPRRFVLVGTGGRAEIYIGATTGQFAESELVALCDLNQTRMDVYNRGLVARGRAALPTYKAADFSRMIREQRPDAVIVCTRDCDHDVYAIRAMELGCDVVCEKPMTTSADKCRAMIETAERTGRTLTVTFNVRYGPVAGKVKELLAAGTIGRLLTVTYEHLLDIRHGADYFRRWHRDRAHSGGLLVHKCTHCFDVVNWWADAVPVSVFARGGTLFYGRRPGRPSGERCHGCPHTRDCRFHWDLTGRKAFREMFAEAEHEDGYVRDQCVFGEGVTTEDTASVSVAYDNGVLLSYNLLAFSPYEGNRVAFTGDAGRLELTEVHGTGWLASETSGDPVVQQKPAGTTIEVFPQFGPAYRVEPPDSRGGHGGADALIVRDLFGPADQSDPFGRRANHLDGARSILVGIAARQSMETGAAVAIDDVLKLPRKR